MKIYIQFFKNTVFKPKYILKKKTKSIADRKNSIGNQA